MRARCQCGRLAVELPGADRVGRHQRRSSAPFGVLAYNPAEQLRLIGEATRLERPAASSGRFDTFLCPDSSLTVYASASKHPALLGAAVGAIADPEFPAPVRPVWEQSMHCWGARPVGLQHFPGGRS